MDREIWYLLDTGQMIYRSAKSAHLLELQGDPCVIITSTCISDCDINSYEIVQTYRY